MELAALMHGRGRLAAPAPASPPGRRPTSPSTPPAEAALAAVDAAIQTHGGNGLAEAYGLVPLWGVARLLRIAPVNREMILQLRGGPLPRPAALLLGLRGPGQEEPMPGRSFTQVSHARRDQRRAP